MPWLYAGVDIPPNSINYSMYMMSFQIQCIINFLKDTSSLKQVSTHGQFFVKRKHSSGSGIKIKPNIKNQTNKYVSKKIDI